MAPHLTAGVPFDANCGSVDLQLQLINFSSRYASLSPKVWQPRHLSAIALSHNVPDSGIAAHLANPGHRQLYTAGHSHAD